MTKTPKTPATVAAQAHLQGLVFQLVDAYRQQRPELTAEAAFELLTAAAWGYAREESTNEEVINRMRAACMACEVARQHAANVLERNRRTKAGAVMTLPKSFEPVRMPCAHYPDFCPRNAVAGSDRCELHQQPRITAEAVLAAVKPASTSCDECFAAPYGDGLLGHLLTCSRFAGLLPPNSLTDEELDAVAVGHSRHRRAHLYEPNRAKLDREALMPFENDGFGGPGARVLMAQPQKPFKPRGLMLWNAAHLNVEAVIIGNQHQVLVSFGKVPAEWFMTSQTYEQVVTARAEGKEPGQGWGSWDTLYPGIRVQLVFDGPLVGPRAESDVKALMWGHST